MPSNNEIKGLSKIYTLAIEDFIKEHKKENLRFDTLFFGKRKNGQSDDFPDVILPKIIEETHIRVVSPDSGLAIQKQNKSGFYVNMIGWVEKEKAEFLFYVFSQGFIHQYNCKANYLYRDENKSFELRSFTCKKAVF